MGQVFNVISNQALNSKNPALLRATGQLIVAHGQKSKYDPIKDEINKITFVQSQKEIQELRRAWAKKMETPSKWDDSNSTKWDSDYQSDIENLLEQNENFSRDFKAFVAAYNGKHQTPWLIQKYSPNHYPSEYVDDIPVKFTNANLLRVIFTCLHYMIARDDLRVKPNDWKLHDRLSEMTDIIFKNNYNTIHTIELFSTFVYFKQFISATTLYSFVQNIAPKISVKNRTLLIKSNFKLKINLADAFERAPPPLQPSSPRP